MFGRHLGWVSVFCIPKKPFDYNYYNFKQVANKQGNTLFKIWAAICQNVHFSVAEKIEKSVIKVCSTHDCATTIVSSEFFCCGLRDCCSFLTENFVWAGVYAVSSCYLRTYQSVTNVRNVYSLTWLMNALRTCIGRTSMVSSGIGREKWDGTRTGGDTLSLWWSTWRGVFVRKGIRVPWATCKAPGTESARIELDQQCNLFLYQFLTMTWQWQCRRGVWTDRGRHQD